MKIQTALGSAFVCLIAAGSAGAAGRPPELSHPWTVSGTCPSLVGTGLAVGDRISVGKEFFGVGDFDLDIRLGSKSRTRHPDPKELHHPTLLLVHDEDKPAQLVTETEAARLCGAGVQGFLGAFEEVKAKHKSGLTYMMGVDYFHDGQPTLIMLVPTVDSSVLLAVIPLMTHEQARDDTQIQTHNGIVHGNP